MSFIDCFRHEMVGYFGGVPVYHPLQKISGDFSCDETQLVLGGGCGEHPALIIKNPLASVAWFLRSEIDELAQIAAQDSEHTFNAVQGKWEYLVEKYDNKNHIEHLEFCEWSVATYKYFFERCTSLAMLNPFFEESEQCFESWLIMGFGEFIFFAMPELAAEIMEQLENPYDYFGPMRFNNILIVPKNAPVYANGGNAFTFL